MRRLALALERARTCRSRIAKEQALADGLRDVALDGDDVALATAARIAAGRVLPAGDGRSLGVGGSLVFEIVRTMTGWDDEIVIASARATGELAEAFALLVDRIEDADRRPGVSLVEFARLAEAIANEPARARKRAHLEAIFSRATPLETKYLAKALGGEMRIGAQQGMVEGAIGRAFDAPPDRIRKAAALVTDVGELAVMARRGKLDEARWTPGRPLAFMLATPLETIATPLASDDYAVEDKIDGVRAQAHRTSNGSIAIFARGLDRVTDAFPEVVEALRSARGCLALDGEIIALTASGRPRPFQSLQARLGKSRPSTQDLAETRVALVTFDLLADDAGPLLDRPWRERRARLPDAVAALVAHGGVVVHPTARLAPGVPLAAAIDAAFDAARARGHEGLVLKRFDAPYDAGRRGQGWIKVKRAHATLDVVVVAAEEGHGRRAGVLSDYTFAVWRDEELVPVGKAYSGLTDDEIEGLSRRLDEATIERVGGLRVVRPAIVLEVAFDGVQRSSRHASGFALRFPRIARIRDDKGPEGADRIDVVEGIFQSQIASGHREGDSPSAPTRSRSAKRTPKAARAQLSLFGDDE